MAESERDERVTQAYRALGGDEPPAALDAAILSAARRRGLRWHAPVAAAAALVLAVGVALVVQREEPRRAEEVALAPRVISTPAPATAPEARRDRAADALKPGKQSAGRAALSKAREQEAQAPAAAEPAPARMADESKPSMIASAPSRSLREPIGAASGEIAEDRPTSAAAGALRQELAARPETPAQWLERIAKLRDAGRAEEADDALAEFRKRYPDYEIPKEMRARVLPR